MKGESPKDFYIIFSYQLLKHKLSELEADAENEKFLQSSNPLNQIMSDNVCQKANGHGPLANKVNGEIFNDNFDVKFQTENSPDIPSQQNQSTAQIINKSQQLFSGVDMGSSDPSYLVFHGNKELKYISNYLPNNKCDENIDHHDHENEAEHLHKHRTNGKETTCVSEQQHNSSEEKNIICKSHI